MTQYLYGLVDPTTDSIRYVGKTSNLQRRYRRHLTESGRTHRHNWIASLRSFGLVPGVVLLEEVDDTAWQERERWWIAALSDSLLNHTAGGDGAAGVSPSPVTRARIAASVQQHWHQHPRQLSPEHRAALSDGCHRAVRTAEWRAKISRANTGHHHTATTIEQIRQRKIGHRYGSQSAERRAKISASRLGERNPMAKLTVDDARRIRERYAQGGISLSALGRVYGVDTKQIHRIVRGQAWAQA